MRLFGLIGYPLLHSFSKKYFTTKFEKEGLNDCRYELFPITSITQVPSLLKKHPGLIGLNITIPYKKQIMQYLDSAEGIAAGLDACNCIRIRDGKLTGFNTDIMGFEKSLRPLLQPHHTHSLVLGNGGATAAIVYGLKKLGISFQILSRELHNGSTLTYKDLNKSIIEQHTLIINTTPLGMHPDIKTCPDIPYHFITDKHLLYDLVYNPPKTLFLQKGEEQNAAIKNGEEMLIIQAEESWKIWNS